MRLPDGTPAADVPVNITVAVDKSLQIWQGTTDSDGAVYSIFNKIQAAEITVKVSTVFTNSVKCCIKHTLV